MMRRFVVALAAYLIFACSGEPDSPETAVRAALAAVEAAATERDVDGVKAQISDAYKDARQNDKQALVQLAALHLLRNQAVYTFSRIQALEIEPAGTAQVQALVALAGRPIPDAEALATVRADLYRFDVTLREEEPGTWRVVSAAWQPATLADFR
jgi:hypothetical protein